MKKLLILVDKLYQKHKDLARAIEAQDLGVTTFLRKINDIDILIQRNKIEMKIEGLDLKEFDMVFFRRVGDLHVVGSLIVYLDKLGIPFVDQGLRNTSVRMDKLTSLIRCLVAGIDTIPTYYCNFKDIDKKIKILGKKFGYPLIAKKIHEHFMKGVYIIKNETDIRLLKDEAKNSRNSRFIFQPYMDLESEHRFLVLGEQVKVIHTKVKRDYTKIKVDYFDQNSQEEYLDPDKSPQKLKDTAVKAAKALGLEIAGVDICIEKATGRPYILEVNRGPAFNYNQKISPELSEVSKFLVKKIKSHGKNK